MTWARFEDRFPWHRKVRPLSDAAFRLHVSAICWCCEHLTDGKVDRDELSLLSDVRKPEPAAAELTRRGLWVAAEGGWQVNDFLVYNESRDVILVRREADAERKRRGRSNRTPPERPSGVQADGAPDSDMESPTESVRTGPSRPEPTTEPPTEVLATQASKPNRGTRIPDAFPLTEALTAWGREHAPAVDGRAETENWLDWHRAKGDTAKDWTASWRTWMRRAQKDTESPRMGRLKAVDNRRSGDDAAREAHEVGMAWLLKKTSKQMELGA